MLTRGNGVYRLALLPQISQSGLPRYGTIVNFVVLIVDADATQKVVTRN